MSGMSRHALVMTWNGKEMALVTDFQEIPKVPGQPGQ